MNPLDLVRPNIAVLKPYSTARDEYRGPLGIFLDANENPYDNNVNRYPSTSLKESLRSRVAALKGVAPANLFLGNGSDEAIDLCYRIFCRPGIDNAIMIAPSYGMYEVCANINDVECRKVQLGEEFALPTEALLAAADTNSKLLFVCSPNNPTANSFGIEEIVSLLERFRGIVVVDEAYIDFSSGKGMLPLLDCYPNLIILQTLSKAYAMAGLRVGLAIASEEIISIMKQVKYPYNIGSDTIQLALKMLDKDISGEVGEIKSERNRIAEALAQMGCVLKVYPSDANFLLVKFTDPTGLYNKLITNGLIVRDRSHTAGCEGTLRITVGTPAENDKLLEVIKHYE
ncbi:MAG: histidinol-phosphate transaminase [Bacteroidales bacterium]|nr:histidinol-phosphate transaminase [Bacteroidales bacterium]